MRFQIRYTTFSTGERVLANVPSPMGSRWTTLNIYFPFENSLERSVDFGFSIIRFQLTFIYS